MVQAVSNVLNVTFVDRRPLRPPLSLLYFDIQLYNPVAVTRYFLFSDDLSASEEPGDYNIDVAYVYELSGRGRAMVCHFAGSRGFFALLLPAGARLELHNLPLQFWGEIPRQVTMTVTIGDDLQIAGQMAGEWLGINLGSDLNATVDAVVLADQREVVKSRTIAAKDRSAVALTAAEELRLKVSTSL